MTVNGHFASVGATPTMEQYERGIQIINENQEFKYVPVLNVPHFFACSLIDLN